MSTVWCRHTPGDGGAPRLRGALQGWTWSAPRPCTMRFDMVHTAVTTTRKSKARSCCTGGTRSPLGILGEHDGRDPLIGLVIGQPHDQARAGITEVALERQPAREGRAAKHGHEILGDANRGLRTDHFGLDIREG